MHISNLNTYKFRLNELIINLENIVNPLDTAHKAINLFSEICSNYQSYDENLLRDKISSQDSDWICLYDGSRLDITLNGCEIVTNIENSSFENAFIYLPNDIIWNISKNDKGISVSVIKNSKLIYDLTQKFDGTIEDEKDINKKIKNYLEEIKNISSSGDGSFGDISLSSSYGENLDKGIKWGKKAVEVAASVGAVLSGVLQKQKESKQHTSIETDDKNIEQQRGEILGKSMSIEIVLIDKSGKIYNFSSFPITFGRLEGCNIVINDNRVSRNHAQILEKDGVLYLQDMGSANGTFYKGQRINQMVQLKHGDIFLIVDHEYRVEIPNTQPEKTVVISNIATAIQSKLNYQEHQPQSQPQTSFPQNQAKVPQTPIKQPIQQTPQAQFPPNIFPSQPPSSPLPPRQPDIQSYEIPQLKPNIPQNSPPQPSGQIFQPTSQPPNQIFSPQFQPPQPSNIIGNQHNYSFPNQQANKVFNFCGSQPVQQNQQVPTFSDQSTPKANYIPQSNQPSNDQKKVFVYEPPKEIQQISNGTGSNLKSFASLLMITVIAELGIALYIQQSLKFILEHSLHYYAPLIAIIILSFHNDAIQNVSKKYVILGCCAYLLYRNYQAIETIPTVIRTLNELSVLFNAGYDNAFKLNQSIFFISMLLRTINVILIAVLGTKLLKTK